MKLEVGNYVRIQWGNGEQTISKCTNKFDIGNTQYSNNDFYIHTDKKSEVIYKNMILKASNNIIDLIEVGDYVNGYKVINTGTEELGHKFITLDFNIDCDELHWGECTEIENSIDIKSIVTKEMFESMQYKVD